VASLRYVDTTVERARWRATASVRPFRRLLVGIEFNIAAEEVNPIATWFLTTEGHKRPAAFLGTSSDRIGSPPGTQAYYVTFAKHAPGLPLSGYISLNWSEWDDGFNIPFGITGWIGENFSIQPMYDGDRAHLTVNYVTGQFGLSLLWVWFEDPGFAVSTGF